MGSKPCDERNDWEFLRPKGTILQLWLGHTPKMLPWTNEAHTHKRTCSPKYSRPCHQHDSLQSYNPLINGKSTWSQTHQKVQDWSIPKADKITNFEARKDVLSARLHSRAIANGSLGHTIDLPTKAPWKESPIFCYRLAAFVKYGIINATKQSIL